MRKIIPIVLVTGLVGPAEAAFYQIDLSTVEPVGRGYTCYYCDLAGGPIFPVMYFSPGDTVDFGTVTLAAEFDGHDWARSLIPGTSVMPDQKFYYAEPAMGVSFNPAVQPISFYGGPGTQTLTFDLTYTIPADADSIQVGWGYRDSIYVPPAVPEPSTWAMLLLGFALLAGVASQRQRLA